MPQTPYEEPLSVRHLQTLAAEAAAEVAAPTRKPARSRAASLHLIDLLSRWGGPGLAIFAATAVFITTVVARDMPLRAGVWAAMLFAALYLCRRYRKSFRAGEKIASRPFRWRAHYTSTMAVVSGAFGAGAFLLAVPAATDSARFEIIGLLLLATVAAATFHISHRLTALAAMVPASAFVAAALLRMEGLSLVTLSAVTILAIATGALWIASAIIADAADRKYPRTGLVRREIDRPDAARPAGADLAKAAAKA
jgi:hypothetical protein